MYFKVILKIIFLRLFRLAFIVLSLILFQKCIDPVTPEFEFSEELVFIDGFITTQTKGSYVSVRKSKLEYGLYVTTPILGCKVSFINKNQNKIISLNEIEGVYLPDNNFKINPGEKWELNVVLPNGENYNSIPEVAPSIVNVNSVNAIFNDKVTSVISLSGVERDISGHKIFVDFDDPIDEENYYLHRFKVYEKTVTCKTCTDGVYRNGECLVLDFPPYQRFQRAYYLANRDFTYGCEVPCWNINYNDETKIFSDEFTNGLDIKLYEIGNVPLISDNPFFVTVQQFNITQSAFNYYKTLKDVSENTSSLNAPLPTALIGNLFNPNNIEEFVLGRFTVASESNSSLFQNRKDFRDKVTNNASAYGIKKIDPEIYGMPLPEPLTYFAPCEETRFRTAIEPQGWSNVSQD